MGASGSTGAEPDIHVDLIEAFVLACVDLAGLDALKVAFSPVGKVRFQCVGQFIQAAHAGAKPGKALHDDNAGLSGVGLVGHAGHEGGGVLDV